MPTDDNPFLRYFADPELVARYVEGPRQFVPGLDALHCMTTILLDERAPPDARVLVVGAGGGLELKAMAETQPGWTFVGVDPAPAMLQLAERTLGYFSDRVSFVEGYVDDSPAGPFDAATCLLTLHFLEPSERLRTVKAIHDRLKRGAPFVVAHGSFPQDTPSRSAWLDRYSAYAVASGADPDQAAMARTAVAESVQMLAPEQDEMILRDGGFTDATLFYAAFTWRGWLAHA